MPATKVVLYQETGGRVPLLEWLAELPRKSRANCIAQVLLLAQYGHELHRPAADYLRDGIYELRVKTDHVQCRVLYFFHGREAVVLSHGIIKRGGRVPLAEIDLAIRRKQALFRDPDKHTSFEVI